MQCPTTPDEWRAIAASSWKGGIYLILVVHLMASTLTSSVHVLFFVADAAFVLRPHDETIQPAGYDTDRAHLYYRHGVL